MNPVQRLIQAITAPKQPSPKQMTTLFTQALRPKIEGLVKTERASVGQEMFSTPKTEK